MTAADSAQTPPPQVQLMQRSMGFAVPFILRRAAQLCLADHLTDGHVLKRNQVIVGEDGKIRAA